VRQQLLLQQLSSVLNAPSAADTHLQCHTDPQHPGAYVCVCVLVEGAAQVPAKVMVQKNIDMARGGSWC
jgi:hypothetical protein